MNFIKITLLITMLLLALIYTTNILSIPTNIVLFENEELNVGEIFGVCLQERKANTVMASSSSNNVEEKTVAVKLFNVIKIKDIHVSTIKNSKVVPLGNSIGIKLYSNGVLVIGMTEIEGKKPYENTGIKEGDLITQVDNINVTTTAELIENVNKSNGKNVEIKYLRDGDEYIANIEPVKAKDNKYKIGLWVRDGACGIGTATYYEPETGKIATLGHGIVDKDTAKLITIESGEFVTSSITKIKKGEKGTPGEIRGIIDDEHIIGKISQNTKFGIYGTLNKTNSININTENSLEVALKDEIKLGKATILLCLDDGIRKEYEISIKKIYKNNSDNNKSMLIEIIDPKLIEKTGGIIQGMSGAPIIQNGKFIGAITHVLVNNPLQGYAVFGEIMVKQMGQ